MFLLFYFSPLQGQELKRKRQLLNERNENHNLKKIKTNRRDKRKMYIHLQYIYKPKDLNYNCQRDLSLPKTIYMARNWRHALDHNHMR